MPTYRLYRWSGTRGRDGVDPVSVSILPSPVTVPIWLNRGRAQGQASTNSSCCGFGTRVWLVLFGFMLSLIAGSTKSTVQATGLTKVSKHYKTDVHVEVSRYTYCYYQVLFLRCAEPHQLCSHDALRSPHSKVKLTHWQLVFVPSVYCTVVYLCVYEYYILRCQCKARPPDRKRSASRSNVTGPRYSWK